MSKRQRQPARAAAPAMPAARGPAVAPAPSETQPAAGPEPASRLLRVAVIIALVGLVLMGLFLVFGFLPWTVGLGMFVGMPLIALAMLVYLIAVVLDLRHRGAL